MVLGPYMRPEFMILELSSTNYDHKSLKIGTYLIKNYDHFRRYTNHCNHSKIRQALSDMFTVVSRNIHNLLELKEQSKFHIIEKVVF